MFSLKKGETRRNPTASRLTHLKVMPQMSLFLASLLSKKTRR